MYRIKSAAPGSSRLHDAAFCQSWNNFTIIGANAGNETLPLITPPLNPTNHKALWNNPSMFLSIAETFPVTKTLRRKAPDSGKCANGVQKVCSRFPT